LTLVFFTVFSRAPVLPTVLVVALSFGPTIADHLAGSAAFALLILIAMGLAVLGLLAYAAVTNPEYFKGKPGWWVPPAIFGVGFLVLGMLPVVGARINVSGLVDVIVLGMVALVCLSVGILTLVEARKGTEWADTGSGIVVLIFGVVLLVVAIVVASRAGHRGRDAARSGEPHAGALRVLVSAGPRFPTPAGVAGRGSPRTSQAIGGALAQGGGRPGLSTTL
jgi:hypothetical protein